MNPLCADGYEKESQRTCYRISRVLWNELGTALRTTCGDDRSAAFGCHTGTEAVGTRAVQFAGLKSAFHRNVPLKGDGCFYCCSKSCRER